MVCSCAELTPFEDRRREPGTDYIYVGASKPNAPAICYNPLLHNEENIKAQADEICQKNDSNTKAELVNTDYFTCRLLIPARAYYKCVTKE